MSDATGPPRRIRSYVIRQARMTSAQKLAYEEVLPDYQIPYSNGKDGADSLAALDWPGPVVMEIGFGMGHATAEIAEANPSTLYLGCEVHRPGIGALCLKMKEKGLQNIRILQHDAIEVLENMVPEDFLDGVHLFFPDPWPKKKHHKRRIFQADFLAKIAKALRPGAYLYAVTDWENYAQQMLDLASASPDFLNPSGDFSEPISWRPATAFENKGLRKNHQIRELYLVRGAQKPVG